jgi:hypothetical protein
MHSFAKPQHAERAQTVFKGTDIVVQNEGAKDSGVELTMEGTRHLGAAIGSNEFKSKFLQKKVNMWVADVQRISQIAHSQPQYAAFTHCLQRQWTFISRSMRSPSPSPKCERR